MHTVKKKSISIQRIGVGNIINEAEIYSFIYKSLGIGYKLNKNINENYLRDFTSEKTLIYHPFYIAKTVVLAERPPFPPKKTPNLIFVDGVSGYRGVFSKVPPITEEEVEEDFLVPVRIPDDKAALQYIKDVQQNQINRSYVLKKPLHDIKGVTLHYLPIWKVVVNSGYIKDVFFINANTGESEKYLSSRWRNGKDLL
ncbi:hypothetical protein [Ornithinibacillus sp. 179-J 7C1 HS]|uniref:hypothetical protein n=1 Tax=Ornithinibacillus sp. 179-J 7C1 HS TaxID=3142384 RepID=UPI0039A2741C